MNLEAQKPETQKISYKRQRVILSPVITFKSTQDAQNNCYTFLVRPSANKFEIAKEFKEIFGGEVKRVNTTADRAHNKATKKGRTRKADGKKAFIFSTADLDIFPKLDAVRQ